jgi:hypothetical protein
MKKYCIGVSVGAVVLGILWASGVDLHSRGADLAASLALALYPVTAAMFLSCRE